MKWADALQASKIDRAYRKLTNPDNRQEPNIILWDPKFLKAPKLFHGEDSVAWTRVKLKEAEKHQDWEPAESLDPPYPEDDSKRA